MTVSITRFVVKKKTLSVNNYCLLKNNLKKVKIGKTGKHYRGGSCFARTRERRVPYLPRVSLLHVRKLMQNIGSNYHLNYVVMTCFLYTNSKCRLYNDTGMKISTISLH